MNLKRGPSSLPKVSSSSTPNSSLSSSVGRPALAQPPSKQSVPLDSLDIFDVDSVMETFFPEDNMPNSTTPNQTLPAFQSSAVDNHDDEEGYYKFRIAEVIGHYRIVAQHGKGVFGTVLKAIDIDPDSDGREVAIKIARRNDTMLKSGLHEIDVLKRLKNQSQGQSSYTVLYIEHFLHYDHLCIVLENLSQNLRTILTQYGKNIGLNILAVQEYARNMCLALRQCEKAHIIHADFKPDNILIVSEEKRNKVKLCDFGSAVLEKDSQIAPYNASRFYRAPEVMIGLTPTYAIDMWALGCVIFELYTGRILFPGRSNNDMLYLIQEVLGNFPKKVISKGTPELVQKHFTSDGVFKRLVPDALTHKLQAHPIHISKPSRTLHSQLFNASQGGDVLTDVPLLPLNKNEENVLRLMESFLEQCIVINPDKRITPEEALTHPFIRPYSPTPLPSPTSTPRPVQTPQTSSQSKTPPRPTSNPPDSVYRPKQQAYSGPQRSKFGQKQEKKNVGEGLMKLLQQRIAAEAQSSDTFPSSS
ncbi:putative serine/threonine protein kinase [Blattamonas nauphoetae]|uniref:Serine/threonine protein kinase n=1 Tax=Blattamonas nauphoetae TaxID=2049346 RepID=A0ABQ9YKD4_9EUKA|nr:putative serine/threonine protein kinase [Blattamonas nauphoetae]